MGGNLFGAVPVLCPPAASPYPRSSGVGRTGAFCLLYAAVQEVEAGNGIPELAQLVRRMRQQRKHMLQEKVPGGPWAGGRGRVVSRCCAHRAPTFLLQLHLKFCYEAILQHAEQLLHRHGVGAPAVPKANSASPKVGVGALGGGGAVGVAQRGG